MEWTTAMDNPPLENVQWSLLILSAHANAGIMSRLTPPNKLLHLDGSCLLLITLGRKGEKLLQIDLCKKGSVEGRNPRPKGT